MKYKYIIIFSAFLVLNSQTTKQIKKQLNDAGVTLDQAKQMARDQDYMDTQIKAEEQARNIDLDRESAEPKIKPVGNLQGVLDADQSIVELAEESDDLTINAIDPLTQDTFQKSFFLHTLHCLL